MTNPAAPGRDGPRPRVVVLGLGPAGAELIPAAADRARAGAARLFVRTARHPAAEALADGPGPAPEFLDHLYDEAETVEAVYGAIVETVVAAAVAVAAGDDGAEGRFVAYAVPGSPFVAERSVLWLRADRRVSVEVVPAPSFVDLAWDRLGIDPVASGVRLVDGAAFAVEAAGERGPLLVAQCHSRQVLSDMKLAADDVAGEDGGRTAVVLHHLGLADEVVREVPWAELDRSLEPDHLTSVYVARLAVPVAAELVRLDELVRTLRLRCPWDRSQSHGSLARHLLEETYETLEAIEAVDRAEPGPPPAAVDHLAEELGDVLFQVYFHAVLGAEAGRFTLADVARGVHDKLVARHPHVFGDAVADTADDVAEAWERRKLTEAGRGGVTTGVPSAQPALALVAQLLGKATAVGIDRPAVEQRRREVVEAVDRLAAEPPWSEVDVGELLLGVVDLARRAGIDAEGALRARAAVLRGEIEAAGTDDGRS